MIGLQYGDFVLNNPPNILVHSTDVYSSPESAVQADPLAESDGAVVVKQKYKPKTFSVEGIIRRNTTVELEQAMDEFKAAMAVKNQVFDIEYAGGIRRYRAYALNVMVPKSGRNTSTPFSVGFLCPEGIAWSTTSSDLVTATAITGSNVTIPVTALGTYKVEPLLTVSFASVTGGTAKTVTISNGATLRGLSVTRNWVSGDVLAIDSHNKTVYVNNVPVDFMGQFPSWDVGGGAISYRDDFTSRTATMTGIYTRRWL